MVPDQDLSVLPSVKRVPPGRIPLFSIGCKNALPDPTSDPMFSRSVPSNPASPEPNHAGLSADVSSYWPIIMNKVVDDKR